MADAERNLCFTYCLDDNKWLGVAFEHCPNKWTEFLSSLVCIDLCNVAWSYLVCSFSVVFNLKKNQVLSSWNSTGTQPRNSFGYNSSSKTSECRNTLLRSCTAIIKGLSHSPKTPRITRRESTSMYNSTLSGITSRRTIKVELYCATNECSQTS